MKKKNKKVSLKIISLYLQIFLSIALCVLFIIFLFNHKLLPFLKLNLGLILILLSVNSYIFTKKKIMSILYLIIGIILLIISGLKIWGI